MITHNQFNSGSIGFGVLSADSIAISNSSDNPSFITGIILTEGSHGFEIYDAVTGAVKNTSSRDTREMSGTLSYQPSVSGGNASELYIFSEKSMDGISWEAVDGSLRTMELRNSGEAFETIVSYSPSWLKDEIIRFRFYTDGNITFSQPTATVLGGQTITGPSVFWQLSED